MISVTDALRLQTQKILKQRSNFYAKRREKKKPRNFALEIREVFSQR